VCVCVLFSAHVFRLAHPCTCLSLVSPWCFSLVHGFLFKTGGPACIAVCHMACLWSVPHGMPLPACNPKLRQCETAGAWGKVEGNISGRGWRVRQLPHERSSKQVLESKWMRAVQGTCFKALCFKASDTLLCFKASHTLVCFKTSHTLVCLRHHTRSCASRHHTRSCASRHQGFKTPSCKPGTLLETPTRFFASLHHSYKRFNLQARVVMVVLTDARLD